jgi:lipoate-protein ligase A
LSWHVVNTGFHSGAFNMAFDEYLAFQLLNGNRGSTLRLYGWCPYTLSMGFHQREEEFDIDRLKADGHDVVRRPTGGRAILHAHELTYSVVMKCVDKSPRDIYRYISEGLLRGLSLLGIEAQLAGRDDNLRQVYRDPSSLPCFASSTRYELQYNGKKLVGSAQRRYRDVILQHGSLLLGQEHRRIIDYIAGDQNDLRATIQQGLATKTIEAETILRRTVLFEEAADCVTRGMEDAWGMSFVHEPTPLFSPDQHYENADILHHMNVTP